MTMRHRLPRRPAVALAAIVLLAGLLATPAADARDKRCAAGLHAGKHTSCAIARAVLRKVGRDSENIGDGRRVAVRSKVTGRTYRFFLYRADDRSFTCRARGDRGSILTVRIAT